MFGNAPVIPSLDRNTPTAPSRAPLYMGIAKGALKGLAVGAGAGAADEKTLGIDNEAWGKIANAL